MSSNNAGLFIMLVVLVIGCCCICSSIGGGIYVATSSNSAPAPVTYPPAVLSPAAQAAAAAAIAASNAPAPAKSPTPTPTPTPAPVPTPAPAPATYDNNKTYAIKTAGGYCLNASGGGNSNGTAILQYPCSSPSLGQNEQWLYGTDNTIRPLYNTTMCIDVRNTNSANGTIISLWGCNGGTNQQWTYNPTTKNLVNVGTGSCMDTSGQGATAVQSTIHEWSCFPTTDPAYQNQTWTFTAM